MLRAFIHGTLIYFIWRKCIKSTVYWNYWFSVLFFTIVELMSYAFAKSSEWATIRFLFRNYIFFFLFFSFWVLVYWRVKIKAIYIYLFYDHTDMYWRYMPQSLLAYLTRGLYTKIKNQTEYNPKFTKLKKKKRYTKQTEKKNNLNYEFLYNISIFKWFFIKRLIMYIFLAILIFYYIKILYWSNYLKLIMIFYFIFNLKYNIFIFIYLFLFLNFLNNSFFMNKFLFSYPLRYTTYYININCVDSVQITTEALYEFTFIETYMMIPEETSMYWMAFVDGDWDYKEMWPFWHDVDTIGVTKRFKIPFNWLSRKTYVYDAYHNGFMYRLNHLVQQPYYYVLHEADVHTSLKAIEKDEDYSSDLKLFS